MKIQLSGEQLERLIGDNPELEAELAAGVMANFAHKIADKIARRLLVTRLAPEAEAIESELVRHYENGKSTRQQQLSQRWKPIIEEEVKTCVRGLIKSTLEDVAFTGRIRDQIDVWCHQLAMDALKKANIGGQVAKIVQDEIGNQVEVTIKSKVVSQ